MVKGEDKIANHISFHLTTQLVTAETLMTYN